MKKSLNIASICSFSFLLFTQMGCTEKSSDTDTAQETGNTASCYSFVLGKNITAIQLSQDGSNVSGYYSWRPYEKDGAYGMLEGSEADGKITADYTYIIEGSTQAEQIVLKRDGDDLLQGTGELEEKGEKLMFKDINNLEWQDRFTKADCNDATVKDAIDAAEDASAEIEEG